LSQRIEKLKDILQNPDTTAKAKQKAVVGLVTAGISHGVIQSWAMRGSADQEKAKRIRGLRWTLSTQSGATGEQRKKAVEQLLESGVRSETISLWARL